MARTLTLMAALLGAVAVILGAFAAHALDGRLDDKASAWWQTATHYQAWHSVALLCVALLYRQRPQRALAISGGCFVIGIGLFSGSLYAMALGAPRLLGAVTPLGGIAMILGWALLAFAAFDEHDDPDKAKPR